jgi:hypothetical protein
LHLEGSREEGTSGGRATRDRGEWVRTLMREERGRKWVRRQASPSSGKKSKGPRERERDRDTRSGRGSKERERGGVK